MRFCRMLHIALLVVGVLPSAVGAADGRQVYEAVCAGCHNTGLIGAPKIGVAADWAARLKNGAEALYRSAIGGTPKGMPPKGGRADLPDADVRAAVDHMLARSGSGGQAAPAAGPEAPRGGAKAPVAGATPRSSPGDRPQAGESAAVAPAVIARAAPPASARPAPAAASADDVNAFNRLLRPAARGNLPPSEDGIHDPANDGTHTLQPPLTAFARLPRTTAGNRVDWVAALGEKRIAPRWDRTDAKAEPVVMDLNIVREVKGSMPDVVYPHKQHTEWLDCANCHPAIFVPQKGANQISMAAILLGQSCGVCHGKVAFPVSDCRRCHSRKKEPATAGAAGARP